MRKLSRIIIYPKDIAIITGKSERFGRLLLSRIKSSLNKEDHQLVSIKEFSNYVGIEFSEIIKALNI